jgi:glucosamine--fructose-6-phosphate aminotransferase (isomerizing)
MCGIFGYIGNTDVAKMVATGLKRLEYRGYDSWGVAVLEEKKIHLSKAVGAIGDYEQKLELPESFIGIGHTRWATHGSVKELNAHPHYSTDKSFALAQNGILENYLR